MTNDSINPVIDEAARRLFEAAWQNGQPAAIEQYLPPAQDPAYLGTLEEFVHIELEFAWRSGLHGSTKPPRVEGYVARFPQLGSAEVVKRLVRQEYRVRHQYGDRPPLSEYASRFPQLSDSPGELALIASVEPAAGPMASARQGSGASWSGPLPTPHIDGYEISDRLGEGAMGVVWKAVQLSTRRIVALKLTSAASIGSDRARLRFQREVELTARLEHPHIARVYDGGQCNGICFYAMEYVQGVALDQYIKHAALPRPAIIELMRTICLAVDYAHQKGVIHRDLKPANILVNADGQPRVLDFGLAKGMGNDGGVTLTIDGAIAGTPAYMSPEQAAGQRDQLDARSDVYSLGVILFHLVCGKYPHDVSGSVVDVMRRISQQIPARLRQIEPDADRELDAILAMALAPQPQERYASAGRLAVDLGRYSTGESLEARVPTLGCLLKKRIRRHRLMSVIAIVMLLCAAGTTAFYYLRHSHPVVRATPDINHAAPVEQVVLQDDFNSPLPRGVPSFGDTFMSLQQVNGAIQITGRYAGVLPVTYEKPQIKNFTADVDIRDVVPGFACGYGLVCRCTPGNDLSRQSEVVLLLVPDKNKAVLRFWKTGNWVSVKEFPIAEGLFRESERNHLRFEAAGTRFRAWLNGSLILDLEDESVTQPGSIGLCISPGTSSKAVGEFRNLRVTAPS